MHLKPNRDQGIMENRMYRSFWSVIPVSLVSLILPLESSTDQVDLYPLFSCFSWSGKANGFLPLSLLLSAAVFYYFKFDFENLACVFYRFRFKLDIHVLFFWIIICAFRFPARSGSSRKGPQNASFFEPKFRKKSWSQKHIFWGHFGAFQVSTCRFFVDFRGLGPPPGFVF